MGLPSSIFRPVLLLVFASRVEVEDFLLRSLLRISPIPDEVGIARLASTDNDTHLASTERERLRAGRRELRDNLALRSTRRVNLLLESRNRLVSGSILGKKALQCNRVNRVRRAHVRIPFNVCPYGLFRVSSCRCLQQPRCDD